MFEDSSYVGYMRKEALRYIRIPSSIARKLIGVCHTHTQPRIKLIPVVYWRVLVQYCTCIPGTSSCIPSTTCYF
jgi:hypothetical protein